MKTTLTVKFKSASRSFICRILLPIAVNLALIGHSWAAFESILSDPTLRILFSAASASSSDRVFLQFNHLRRYDLPELSVNRLNATYRMRSFDLNVGWAGCGDELYNESKLTVGVGDQFKQFNIDAELGLYFLQIKNYGQAHYVGGRAIICRELEVFSRLEIGAEAISAPEMKKSGNIPFKGWGLVQINDWELLSLTGGLYFPGEWDASLMVFISGMLTSNFGYEFGLQDAPQKLWGDVIVELERFRASMRVSYQPGLGLEQGIGITLKF